MDPKFYAATSLWDYAQSAGCKSEHLKQMASSLEGKRVLEIGSGNGYDAVYMKEKFGADVFVCEPDRHWRDFEKTAARLTPGNIYRCQAQKPLAYYWQTHAFQQANSFKGSQNTALSAWAHQ
ncbi:hypothetical protein [Treponema sp. R6D11]